MKGFHPLRGPEARLCLLACILLPVLAEAGSPSPTTSDASTKRVEGMELLVQMEKVDPHALFGLRAVDAATGEVLMDLNGGRNLIPASTAKLFTAWAVLDQFGPDHRFQTALRATGLLKEGVLEGNLILAGAGDPSFCSRFFGEAHSREAVFSAFATELRRRGVRRISGMVVGDNRILAPFTPNPAFLWEDVGNYYGAMVSGLCFADNRFLLRLTGSGRAGGGTQVLGTDPVFTGISSFDNRVTVGIAGSGDKAFIFGVPSSTTRVLRGTYAPGADTFTIQGALPDPAWTAAREFAAYLEKNGFILAKSTKDSDSGTGGDYAVSPSGRSDTIVVHQSPRLQDLLRYMLAESDNMYAEQLLAMLAVAHGKSGEPEDGPALLMDLAKKSGIGTGQIHLRDACGLSKYNWVSPQAMTELLRQAGERPPGRGLLSVLPSGADQAGRFGIKPGEWQDRLWLKTGYLEGVVSVAGYLKTASGRLVCFHFCANNSSAPPSAIRRAYGEILEKLGAGLKFQ